MGRGSPDANLVGQTVYYQCSAPLPENGRNKRRTEDFITVIMCEQSPLMLSLLFLIMRRARFLHKNVVKPLQKRGKKRGPSLTRLYSKWLAIILPTHKRYWSLRLQFKGMYRKAAAF